MVTSHFDFWVKYKYDVFIQPIAMLLLPLFPSSRTSDRSGSRVPSRNKGGSGGIFFNPLASKGSRSFLGSKSSLSSSRRNLASESLRALAAQATVRIKLMSIQGT